LSLIAIFFDIKMPYKVTNYMKFMVIFFKKWLKFGVKKTDTFLPVSNIE